MARIVVLATWHRRCGPYYYAQALKLLGHEVLCVGPWRDEEPGKIDTSKIPTLRAAFGKDGVLTAASSSKISDGAAATVLMSAEEAAKDADALLICTEWPVFREFPLAKLKTLLKHPVVLDGRNLFDPAAMKAAGFDYRCVGRP